LELRAETAATRVANDLKTNFFAVVDEFLPPRVAAALAGGVRALHGAGRLAPGEVEGGRMSRVGTGSSVSPHPHLLR